MADVILTGTYENGVDLSHGLVPTMKYIELVYTKKAHLFSYINDETGTYGTTTIKYIAEGWSYFIDDPYLHRVKDQYEPIEDIVNSTMNFAISHLNPYGDIKNLKTEGETINPVENGESFAKFRVSPLPNDVYVRSLLNVIDTDGRIYGSRLDPVGENTWFNSSSDAISNINSTYVPNHEYPTVTATSHYEGQVKYTYYGTELMFEYTNIDGYYLTAMRFYGLLYNISNADNSGCLINTILVIDGTNFELRRIYDEISDGGEVITPVSTGTGYAKYRLRDGGTKIDEGIDVDFVVSYNASTKTYSFEFSGDVISFLQDGFVFETYSTPIVFDVDYHSNKKTTTTSPLIFKTFNAVGDSAIAVKNVYDANSLVNTRVQSTDIREDKTTTQKFVYNQTYGFNDATGTSNKGYDDITEAYQNLEIDDRVFDQTVVTYTASRENNPVTRAKQ